MQEVIEKYHGRPVLAFEKTALYVRNPILIEYTADYSTLCIKFGSYFAI